MDFLSTITSSLYLPPTCLRRTNVCNSLLYAHRWMSCRVFELQGLNENYSFKCCPLQTQDVWPVGSQRKRSNVRTLVRRSFKISTLIFRVLGFVFSIGCVTHSLKFEVRSCCVKSRVCPSYKDLSEVSVQIKRYLFVILCLQQRGS